MSRTKHVAVIIDTTRSYHRKIIRGIAAYVRDVSHWSLYVDEEPLDKLPQMDKWKGHGIIAALFDRRIARHLTGVTLPIVSVERYPSWFKPASGVSLFCCDNAAVGRLGAEHLLEQGFRSLAYCGVPRTSITYWSAPRGEAFRQRAREAGVLCRIYTGRHIRTRRWADLQRGLTAWLRTLEKPVGILAANDNRARHVLEACRTIGARVPDDVAVMGVDNDEMICELAQPPLTSVELGARQLGYQAAALLDKLMSGKRVRQKEFLFPPEGVVPRQSTDVLALNDPDVVDSLRFIREHAVDGINVSDVVKRQAVSRSSLETKFKALVGQTIHARILKVQLQRAKELIAATNQPLKDIAVSVGFSHIQHMTNLFRRFVGQTPSEFRRNAQHPNVRF